MILSVAIAESFATDTPVLRQRATEARQLIAELDRSGNLKEAVAACEEILAVFPDEGDILVARVNLLRRLGRRDEAVAAAWQAIGQGHDQPGLWQDAATALIELNRLPEARAVLDQALGRDPRQARSWILLGELLRKQQKDPAAEPCFRRAAALAERDTVPRLRLAQILSQWGRFEEAARLFDEAYQRENTSLDAISGYAQALISRGRLAESIPQLLRVLDGNGEHLDARLGAARALLLSGNLKEGWPAYEGRRRRADLKLPKLQGPEWDGSPLLGKTIVVYAEQGFGDVLQFVRYIPVLAARGAQVILIVPVQLLALTKCLETDAVSVRVELGNLPPYDFHIPLLSVPWRLDSDWADIPATVPYLQVPPDKSASIKAPAGTRLKVGLVWAGSPTHANDGHRSAGLRALLPLAGVHGVTLYSLQVGPRAPDLSAEAHHALIEPVAPKLKDYGDTAAVIEQLDLVISVDTSVVHLAGALGKPVWVLLPYAPDWRWLLHREDSPWYPTLRLFRQTAPNRWDDVVERLVEALSSLAAERPEVLGDEASSERAHALFQAGLKHQQAGKLGKALDAYTQSAVLDRRNPDLFNNLGVAMQGMERMAAAEACYRRAAALRPEDVGCLSNLGSALRHQGKLDEAEAVYDRARALDPTLPRPVFNAGHVYRDQGRPEQALACFDRTLELEPDNKEALWDRTLALLQKGDYAEGLRGYEARWGLKTVTRRPVALPLWDGGPLNGRSIYLQDEQGFGDALQFARFIPEVVRRGAGKVILECQPELMRLFSLAPGVDAVVGRHAGTPGCSCYAPLMSLPGILGISLADLPGPVPYLKAPPPTLPLPSDGRLKIGLVWAGKSLPRDRSCPLPLLLPHLGDPRFAVYSLQVGERAADLKASGADAFVTDLGPRLHDFAETAAVLKQLDLLITIDTSVAHLAGALGVPTLTLLHFSSDWRWFDVRPDSPWYPTMRLIRQSRPNHWDDALKDLAGALDDFAATGVVRLPEAPQKKRIVLSALTLTDPEPPNEAVSPGGHHGSAPDSGAPALSVEGLDYSISARDKSEEVPIAAFIDEFFHDVPVKSVFAFTEYTPLYGGRPFLKPELSAADIHWMYDLGIGYRIPLQNNLIARDDYLDNKPFLEKYHRAGNSVITVRPEVAQWIRDDFPLFEIEASVVNQIRQVDKVDQYLDNFDIVVLHPQLNDSLEDLARLPDKGRIRLFANAGCMYQCPTMECYASFARINKREAGSRQRCAKMHLPSYAQSEAGRTGMWEFDVEALTRLGFFRFKKLRNKGNTGY